MQIRDNCAPFTNCIFSVNSTQVDEADDIDFVMLIYILLKWNDNYSKAFWIL